MDIVKLKKQNIWGIPAVINFTLGSMGAGYYIFSVLHSRILLSSTLRESLLWESLTAVVLILLGFFSLLFEAGNPKRNYLTLLNVKTSWMSREILFAALFIGLIALDLLYPHIVISAAAAVTGLLFILSQAFIIYKSRAIVSWNVRPVLPLFVLSGLLSGYGLLLFIVSAEYIVFELSLAGLLLLLFFLGIILFYLFFYRKEQADFRQATEYLRKMYHLAASVFMGIIIPFLILLFTAVLGYEGISDSLYTLAGFCIILGTLKRNKDIILKAGYFRKLEMQLNHRN
jgi:DMSO reductase anchor subunit